MDEKHEPKRSAAEIARPELHAGGKFNQKFPRSVGTVSSFVSTHFPSGYA
jgi:DNA gyrase/topoisomerase IV subunit B